jgi:hypothetical protein
MPSVLIHGTPPALSAHLYLTAFTYKEPQRYREHGDDMADSDSEICRIYSTRRRRRQSSREQRANFDDRKKKENVLIETAQMSQIGPLRVPKNIAQTSQKKQLRGGICTGRLLISNRNFHSYRVNSKVYWYSHSLRFGAKRVCCIPLRIILLIVVSD